MIMKLLLQPCMRLGARQNDALLSCNLGIILLCFAMPSGERTLIAAAFGVLADFGILACLALICVMSGQSRLRIWALAWLIGFWLVAAFVVMTARRWTPVIAPLLGGMLAYFCVMNWRLAAQRSARSEQATERATVHDAAAQGSEQRDEQDTGGDREVMLQMMHDLRSPLSTVLALIENKSAEREDPGQDDFVESVRDLVQYSLSVAQDFTYLSRAERLDRDNFLPVSLQDLGREAADRSALLAERKGIDIRVQECVEALWVSGDYCMLLRAVGNLLDNAIKYSEASSRITLSVQRQGSLGRVSIADQGIGISDVEFPRLCQAFYQVQSDGRRGSEGVGLGLVLVMTVADAHGGWISVKSRPNVGSVFSLTFPLIAGAVHEGRRDDASTALRSRLDAMP
ncbi:sensor histidine kinase [Achromobacter sp.]|uniref:sensor histidine kinase n=1 Tax=Achromobacter sp. TaxID=134375 RepID=UPI003C74D191